jgi:hypothetical protein
MLGPNACGFSKVLNPNACGPDEMPDSTFMGLAVHSALMLLGLEWHYTQHP